MTEITKEYIEQQINNIQQQKVTAINIVAQAEGALGVYHDLLNRLNTPAEAVIPDGYPAAPNENPDSALE